MFEFVVRFIVRKKYTFIAGAVMSVIYITYRKITEEIYIETRNEIKFVSGENKRCKAHVFAKFDCMKEIYKNSPCSTPLAFNCSYEVLRWMIDFLDSANETLDIASYLVTCVEFKEAILRAHKKRGVKVRVITDMTMSKGSGSAIPDFIREGIPVRMHDAIHMMHRKSAVADGQVVLMGTGNWTMQALAGNHDAWLLTSDPAVVRGYVDGFQEHWLDDVLIQPTYQQFLAIQIHK